MKEHTEKYDFVIIGCGIGGLVSALVLAKNGYKVCVLEKNQQVGGALQTFSRDKRIFDTGVHYIGGLNEGENLYKIFNYLDIYADLKLVPMDTAFDYIRLPNGKTYKQGQGYENFIQLLVEDFPDESEAIQKFVDKVKETCTFFPLYNIELEAEKTYHDNPEVLTTSAWEFVNSITQNNDLIATLLGNGFLYAGDKKRTPFFVVALILNSYINGSYRISNGGSQLAKILVKKIRENGGVIFKRREVISSEVDENKRITSVNCSNGETYLAANFISNLHPSSTIKSIGETHFYPARIKRINSLKNTVSSFVINISLKENSVPFFNHNYYDFFTEDIWNTADYDLENWPQVIFSCATPSLLDAKFANSISAMAYLRIDEFNQWKSTFNTVVKPSDRGEDYALLKKMFEEKIVNRLCERYPHLKDAIINVHSSTPLTFRDYLGTPEGELYGIEKDFNDSMKTVISTKTKIPNLYLTGQNIVFHGILGATIGALVTCFNFIDAKKIINTIKSQ